MSAVDVEEATEQLEDGAPLTPADIGALFSAHREDIRREWSRLRYLDRMINGKLPRTWMPEGADLEYKDLLNKAATPWLKYGRNAKAQGIVVDGFSDDATWVEAWQANGMDGRQGVTTRESIGFGYSFGMSLPTVKADGSRGVVMRPISAMSTYAVFADPWDEYPQWALYRSAKKRGSGYWGGEWYFFDEHHWYRFKGSPATPTDMEVFEHGLGYCPVVRLAAELTTDDTPPSTVEDAIKVWQRIVDYTFTLSMVMRYGAFPQKWAAGGKIDDGVRISIDSLLHAGGAEGEGTRFGTFAAASIQDVVAGLESAYRDLSAILNIPPHYFLGAVVNMSAEGLEAAEAKYFRDIEERQQALSEGYELWLRTAAAILGRDDVAGDVSAEVHWKDQRTRSLAQIADAVTKLIQDGAPYELVFSFIPGWSKQDVLDAAAHAREQAAIEPAADPVDGESTDDQLDVLRKQFETLGIGVRAGVDPDEAADHVGLTGVTFSGIPASVRSQEQLQIEDNPPARAGTVTATE